MIGTEWKGKRNGRRGKRREPVEPGGFQRPLEELLHFLK
jgi:hypothetical protein